MPAGRTAPLRRLAPLALLAANLVPLIGVAFLGWSLLDVMMIYWLENGVIGAFNVARMATAGRAPAGALFFAPFFTVHYGMFWLVHGVFLVELFGPAAFGSGTSGVPDAALMEGAAAVLYLPIAGVVPVAPAVLWGVASIAVSHGVSYLQNWWLAGERQGTAPSELMTRPYVRVVVLHVTILAGGFIVAALGSPLPALALMVLLKTAVDVRAHLAEHADAAAAPGPTPAVASARAR